jgi:hypothetical protein
MVSAYGLHEIVRAIILSDISTRKQHKFELCLHKYVSHVYTNMDMFAQTWMFVKQVAVYLLTV